jgi:adenylate cyclase
MAIEIERKYLVTGDGWRQPCGQAISQGYLSLDKERTVRVRVSGEQGFLTVKGITKGASRAEFEYEIPVADARLLLDMCVGAVVHKVRHVLTYRDKTWEVDEFSGENAPLVMAEIELQDEAEPFERPPWLGEEVTSDPRYYNANLAAIPYSAWTHPAPD